MSNKKWNQATFNTDHTEPRDYGEGEYYVVSNKYSNEEAARIIGDWESGLTGGTHTYAAEDIVEVQMYVDDKNDDATDDWCVANWRTHKPVAIGKAVSL